MMMQVFTAPASFAFSREARSQGIPDSVITPASGLGDWDSLGLK
jgi:hypothetical protein